MKEKVVLFTDTIVSDDHGTSSTVERTFVSSPILESRTRSPLGD